MFLAGAPGCTTAGARVSPMVSRVARVAQALGIPCTGHVAAAKNQTTEEIDAAAHGMQLVAHRPGYLSVVKARAKADAQARGWRYVPFGMECEAYLQATRLQVRALPAGIQRIVMPVGSGLAAAAVLQGLDDIGMQHVPVLGVQVGADPTVRLARWAPYDWRQRLTLQPAALPFDKPAAPQWWGIRLDPHYEAKAAPFVQPGDLFWIVAVRST